MESISSLIFASILIAILHLGMGKPVNEGGVFNGPRVFLTINAEASVDEDDNLMNRMLEINWYNIKADSESWIGVFEEDPSIENSKDPIVRITPTASEGSEKTTIRFSVMNFHTSGIPKNHCMGYWVAYFEASTKGPVTTNCIRIYPNWMEELKGIIGEKPLTRIMIPGTHDTGSWKVYEGRPDDYNLAIKYSITQEDDVYTQLVHGVRYFDLRIGFYPRTAEKYWLNHNFIRMRPLQTLINDVRKFVQETKEIILLDIHGFPIGFQSQEEHTAFISHLQNELGNLTYLKSAGLLPKLNQIWQSDRPIMLSYANVAAQEHDFLWPQVKHDWGDTNKVEELEAYFQRTLPEISCKDNIFSSMAELTPTEADVILRPKFGLRGFAQIVNLPVTTWFRRESWYTRANIVATDFYLGNNIIEMSYEVNSKNAVCPHLN